MPCAVPSPEAADLLRRLGDGPLAVDQIADEAATDELVRWGWAFQRGGQIELSGAGRLHAGVTDGGTFGA